MVIGISGRWGSQGGLLSLGFLPSSVTECYYAGNPSGYHRLCLSKAIVSSTQRNNCMHEGRASSHDLVTS